MSNGILVDLVGEEKVYNLLANMPTVVQDTVLDDTYTYLLDVLRAYPTYQHVSRASAYPEVGGWFSDKQRRWFFANLNEGNIQIPHKRTQDLRRGWKKQGSGQNASIINDRPYAVYVVGEDMQSRMSAKAGWKKPSQILEERSSKIDKIIESAVTKAMRKLGSK